MTEEKVSPLRDRKIEDARIRGMGYKAQKTRIRAIKDFAAFPVIYPTPRRSKSCAPISCV